MTESTFLSLSNAFIVADYVAPWAVAGGSTFIWGRRSTRPVLLFLSLALACWGVFGTIQSLVYFGNLALLSAWPETKIFYLTVLLNWLAAFIALCIAPFAARWLILKAWPLINGQV